MMQPPDKLLLQLPPLQTADAYFCCVRSWWDGAGIDAAIWWSHESEYFLRVIKTGETMVQKPPFFDEVISISAHDFNQLLDYVLQKDFLSFESQDERIAFTHCDYWYGLKTNNSNIEHWIYSKGIIHADQRVMELRDMVRNKAPQLFS